MSENSALKNGVLLKLIQFGQTLVVVAILPWGVWVTGQIYALQSARTAEEQWRAARDKVPLATMSDVEMARLRVKDDLLGIMSTKLDLVITKLNDVDLKLTRHEAATSQRP